MTQIIPYVGIVENREAGQATVAFFDATPRIVPLTGQPITVGITFPYLSILGIDLDPVQPSIIYAGSAAIPVLLNFTITISTASAPPNWLVNLYMEKRRDGVVTQVGSKLVQTLDQTNTSIYSLSLSTIALAEDIGEITPYISFPQANAGAPVRITIRDYTFSVNSLQRIQRV